MPGRYSHEDISRLKNRCFFDIVHTAYLEAVHPILGGFFYRTTFILEFCRQKVLFY